jgi:hypothetical protein
VVPAVTESGENTFALTKEAVKQGALRLQLHRAYYNNAQMHAYLVNWIYQDQTLIDLARPALWRGLAVFLVGLWPVALLERKRTSELRNGRRLRGPQSVKRPLLECMLAAVKKLFMPRKKKNGHVLLTGSTTTGETRPTEQVTEAFPQAPPQTVAAVAPADVSPRSNGTQPKLAATERKTTQEQKMEHAVTGVSKHFFE